MTNNLHNRQILVVDDTLELQKMVLEILNQGGYQQVLTAGSCSTARLCLAENTIDLILLDVMLPDGDGFDFLGELRRSSDVPVIFLSARGEDEDRLLGLGLGADDYITKPFLPRELLLRLNAILKRVYGISREMGSPCLTLGSHTINFDNATVTSRGVETPLRAKELLLLKKLYENQGRIVTADSLCQAAWEDDLYGYENTLMVHIRRLREKIEDDPSHPKYLLTLRGLGYKLVKDAAP